MSVKRQPRDFTFGKILGEGSYSTVVYAKEEITGKEFAVKILDKRQIVREKKVKYVNIEKQVLNETCHPFIIKLFYTFQDDASLYFCLEYAIHGDLLQLLKKVNRFDLHATLFYTGQLIEAIEYLHSRGILHRDVKPENILLDDKMYIKLTDFGCAKILSNEATVEQGRKASFVGTAEYCSPELLNDRFASEKSDVWAIGCVIFQCLSGRHPFKGQTEYQTFQLILQLDYVFPLEFDEFTQDIIKRILVLDPEQRFDLNQVKSHEFYQLLDFKKLYTMEAPILKELQPIISTSPLETSRASSIQASMDNSMNNSMDNSLYSRFLKDNENVVKFSVLKQSVHFMKKTRGLLLTQLRLVLLNLKKQIVHSEFLLNQIERVVSKDSNRFYIQFKQGNCLHFIDSTASDWVSFINQAVAHVL